MGQRPIDLHLKALKEMGATITEAYGYINCEAKRLEGKQIYLDFPSVGATENIMLAAVLAKGETVIRNAAKEPEICDLQIFLNKMGAKIKGSGTDTIVIEGVSSLTNAEHTVMPDRIVAGTYLAAAAITRGEALLKNIVPDHLYPITSKLSEAGCIICEEKNSMSIKTPKSLSAVSLIRTQPHPGLPECDRGIRGAVKVF